MAEDITYYEQDGILYAAVGPFADGGLFWFRQSPTPKWEFVVPNTTEWDSTHQAIFRNYRARDVAPEDLPPDLPPVPAKPKGPAPKWASNFNPSQGLPAGDYPALRNLLAEKGRPGLKVFIVLEEDVYESSSGDGRFDDFKGAFLSEAEAKSFAESKASEWYRYHRRTDTLSIPHTRPDRIFFRGTSWKQFSHHKAAQVAGALEARIQPS